MTLPTPATLFDTLDATWPPERYQQQGDWLLRIGGDGGSRVNCATPMVDAPDLSGCGPLISVRGAQGDLDAQLDAAGYRIKDACRLMVVRSADLAAQLPAGPRTIAGDGPIARMLEIWQAGGIGPARLAIMNRANAPKSYIAGRVGDRPAGCIYVGAKGNVAMLHALEVATEHRRKGLARDLVAACGHWAAQNNAEWLSLIVTEANTGAHALYSNMGFTDIGGYHYRKMEEAQ
ncbi:Acetyltransferase (GNAT) family protein [Monaibacterium marinum]|uniref:Acetyltransferase (GNAT) family protein n=1 Tax=Pontivivens marinum TaxID=1690039 RepID=A0A2C9CTZ2_9RHOB|nr:GNAT family N-acetyltransferase [Monaibacterium marinum]SOH94670.1 Acetyltransferase (GNAT) family protein [Monaibacterium marinum]